MAGVGGIFLLVGSIQFPDVHAQFHRRELQYSTGNLTNQALLAVDPHIDGHLRRVFARLQTHGRLGNAAIEVDKEGVGPTAGGRHVRDPHRVVECLGTVTRTPEERRCRKLVTRHVFRIARFDYLFDDSRKAQLAQELPNYGFRLSKRKASKIRDGRAAADELAKTAAR